MHKVVDQVTALADIEGMPLGLKIVSKTDTILYDLARIAGVDAPNDNYNHKNNNNNEDNEQQQDDKMHPDNIIGLTPTGRKQDNIIL
jgi:hypothetical protein